MTHLGLYICICVLLFREFSSIRSTPFARSRTDLPALSADPWSRRDDVQVVLRDIHY
jgi:hypothetical protein